jgi:hypothetical protein
MAETVRLHPGILISDGIVDAEAPPDDAFRGERVAKLITSHDTFNNESDLVCGENGAESCAVTISPRAFLTTQFTRFIKWKKRAQNAGQQ